MFLGMSRANKQTGAGRRWSVAIFGSVQSEKRCCVCRNMNRSTEDEEKMGSQKIGSGKLSISDDEASADWRDKMAREAQGRLDRLGVGGVGGRLVPVWDKSGTVHEVNRRQARHGKGKQEEMATTSSPALETSISGIAHSKTPILGRGDRHRGTSQSLDKRLIS